MTKIRSAIFALALIAGITPAIAQVPPPVPALPDTQRLTSYTISANTCACSVGFSIFADQADYQNWVKVYLNGAQVQYNDPNFGWKITSPTGVIGLIPQPITNGILTFNSAQTGTVQIVGARRPRRVTQFQEGRGVAARDLNEAFTDIVAQNRENWDYQQSLLHAAPGAQIGAVPTNCPNQYLGFDATGQNFVCTSFGLTGISNYIASVFAATTGAIPNAPTYANGTAGVGATLTAGTNGALMIDGVALTAGNRVLIKDQAAQLQNGVYLVTQAGTASLPYILTRTSDLDQPSEMITGTAVLVVRGLTNIGGGWVLASNVPTVGTSPAIFNQYTSGGGGGGGGSSSLGGVFDVVKQYGADPTGVANSTDAINNAISDACRGAPLGFGGTGGKVWFQPGAYIINGGLNLTNIQNSCSLEGTGITSASLRVTSATNAMLDMTGTAAVTIKNLSIDGQSGLATYGALLAHSTVNACDVNFFENVSFIGSFYIPLYIYGCSDGQFNKMSQQSFNQLSPAIIYISNTNDFAATSVYTMIGTGSTQAGDWIFIGSDLHDLSTFSPAAYSNVVPIYINGSMSPVKFIGGVVGAPVTSTSGGVFTLNSPSGLVNGVSIIGMQFYGDNGLAPQYIVKAINSVNGLTVQGNNAQYGVAFMGINPGLTLSGMNITGNTFSGTSTFSTMTSGNATITGSIIDGQGLTFSVGAGGTFTHNVVTRPGGITAGTQTNNGLF